MTEQKERACPCANTDKLRENIETLLTPEYSIDRDWLQYAGVLYYAVDDRGHKFQASTVLRLNDPQLGELIHKSLRQCDAMARYSENQYVLLISGNSSAENGSTPLERIKAAFYRVPAHGRYLLNYHMYAPELHALSADARRR